MVATDVKPFTTIGHRADENRFPRAIVVLRVRLRRLLAEITLDADQIERGSGECLEHRAQKLGRTLEALGRG